MAQAAGPEADCVRPSAGYHAGRRERRMAIRFEPKATGEKTPEPKAPAKPVSVKPPAADLPEAKPKAPGRAKRVQGQR